MSRSEFDFRREFRGGERPRFRARRVEELRVQPPLVEITAGDVWTAVKSGFGMAFFIGLVAGVATALAGNTSGAEASQRYFRTFVTCLILLPMVWVPLGLGARATSRRSDVTACLLRFGATLFLAVYFLAVLAVVGMMLYVRLSNVGR